MQSIEVHSQSSLIAILSKSDVLSDSAILVKWGGAYYTKKCHAYLNLDLKILMASLVPKFLPMQIFCMHGEEPGYEAS